MGITIDNSIRLLEDYLEWEKQFSLDGSGVDDATNKLLEVAKKYQKIQEIVKNTQQLCSYGSAFIDIRKVIEDGNVD